MYIVYITILDLLIAPYTLRTGLSFVRQNIKVVQNYVCRGKLLHLRPKASFIMKPHQYDAVIEQKIKRTGLRTVDSDIAEICHHVSDFRYSPRCSCCNQIFIGLTVPKNLSLSCSLSQKRKKSKSVLSRNKTKSRTIVFFLTLKRLDYKSRSNRNKIGIPQKLKYSLIAYISPF